MKITNIVVENLGPYVGKNTFEFSVSDPSKNVVLIGGKNGAGKTTLFNSIRVGLYGCRAYGFESDNSKYIEIIFQLVNASAKLNKVGRAGVSISILMDDGKDDYLYTFERTWRLDLKTLKEEVKLTRNGKPLSETEKSDFQSYLLQMIPPDMFRFYFFDGESIGKFVFNGIRNTDFKNAFLKLCGLDTMELIYENFQRVSNTRKKDASGAYDEYQDALDEQRKFENAFENALSRKELLSAQLVAIDESLAKCEQSFIERGGITKKEYQSMQSQLNKEEARREAARKWLKEAANDMLPFVVLKDQIAKLKQQILAEEQRRTAEAFEESISSDDIRNRLFEAFADEGIDHPLFMAERVISILSSVVDTHDDLPQILNLSKREQLELLAKIQTIENFDVKKVRYSSDTIEQSLYTVKQIRKKLEKSDESGSEAYFKTKDSLIGQKSNALQQMLEVEREIDALKLEQANVSARVKRAQQKYEEYLKTKSVNDLTAKALLAFSELQRRLYKKYISDVESSFKECFNKLINKSDLIDGIKIDDHLQVYPYKMRTFKRSEINRLVRESGENHIISQMGTVAYEAYLAESNYDSPEITLPVEVKQQLSAGEKQIFIMALYQALSTLNKVSVPYIIDTPFARIDTQHRQNILNNFFMNLRGQMIILSTDEEIVGSYKDSIESSVSNFYLLRHEDNSGTQIKENCYFGGQENDI